MIDAIRIVAVIVFIPAAIVVDGALMALLWAWFIVPLGAPALGTAHAIGISVLVRLLATTGEEGGEKRERTVLAAILICMGRWGVALLLAFIARGCM
jgi:hypothetical protein